MQWSYSFCWDACWIPTFLFMKLSYGTVLKFQLHVFLAVLGVVLEAIFFDFHEELQYKFGFINYVLYTYFTYVLGFGLWGYRYHKLVWGVVFGDPGIRNMSMGCIVSYTWKSANVPYGRFLWMTNKLFWIDEHHYEKSWTYHLKVGSTLKSGFLC